MGFHLVKSDRTINPPPVENCGYIIFYYAIIVLRQEAEMKKLGIYVETSVLNTLLKAVPEIDIVL